jgi:hypothetical protein
VIVRFVDIDRTVNHRYLSFLFIIKTDRIFCPLFILTSGNFMNYRHCDTSTDNSPLGLQIVKVQVNTSCVNEHGLKHIIKMWLSNTQ